MAQPKSDKIYSATCVATGINYTVRPDVWSKRLEKFNTDSETLKANYIGRAALKSIKSGGDPKENLLALCEQAGRPPITIKDSIWDIYINGVEPELDKDIQQATKAPDYFPYSVADFEVVNATAFELAH